MRGVPRKWKEAVVYNLFLRYCGASHLPTLGSIPHKLLMQVIHDGTASALARLVAYCETSAEEDVEKQWTIIQGQDVASQEERAETEDEDETQTPVSTLQAPSVIRRQVQVNVPPRQGLTSQFTVTKLNTVASRANRVESSDNRQTKPLGPTRLWSTDSGSETSWSPIDTPSKTALSHTQREPAGGFGDDWDMIADDDLRINSPQSLPSAVKKLRRPATTGHSQTIVPSIEIDSDNDLFTAELLRSAYGHSPTPTPTRATRRAAPQPRCQPITSLKTPSADKSNFSSFVDLRNDVVAHSSAKTRPQKLYTKRHVVSDDSDNYEEECSGISGVRQEVRHAMRSLSVQDVEVIDDDEEFMSASEVL